MPALMPSPRQHPPVKCGSGLAGQHLIAPALALLQAAGLTCDTEVGMGDPAHTLIDITAFVGYSLIPAQWLAALGLS